MQGKLLSGRSHVAIIMQSFDIKFNTFKWCWMRKSSNKK